MLSSEAVRLVKSIKASGPCAIDSVIFAVWFAPIWATPSVVGGDPPSPSHQCYSGARRDMPNSARPASLRRGCISPVPRSGIIRASGREGRASG